MHKTDEPTDDTDGATDEASEAAEKKGAIRPEDQDPKLWKADGWTARVLKNEDDDGWAVEMTLDGEPEPALVGPWTMGRDKKNPKPLDSFSFRVLVKTANEVLARHAAQRHAMLHRTVTAEDDRGVRMRVDLDVVPDEDDPHAILTGWNQDGEVSRRARVAANFKLTTDSAGKWLRGGISEG